MGHQHDHEPQRDIPPGMAEQLDLPYAGLVSFGHRPFLTEVEQLESWRPDVAIVGAPFDVATTNRPGARFGPRAMAPAYDVSDLTVNAAHRVVFEALAGMAARQRDAAGAKAGPPAR
jgi:hypothetical protein